MAGNTSQSNYVAAYGIYNQKNGNIQISGGTIESAHHAMYNQGDGRITITRRNYTSL